MADLLIDDEQWNIIVTFLKIGETVFLKFLIINLNHNFKNSNGKVPDGGSKKNGILKSAGLSRHNRK